MLALLIIGLIALGWHFNAKPRHDALRALPDTARVLAAVVVVFGLGGFGLVRLLLPDSLRRFELLWILPTGGCVVGLALTVLGFAGIPFAVSLTGVLVAGLGLSVYAVRRRGWPDAEGRRLAWPLFIAFVVLFVALVPMVLVQHYAAPTGDGSDAHQAVGTAQLLKHAYPTSVDIHQPINQMTPQWRSKYPIYYAYAGVSSVSGLPTWQVIAPLAAAMLALAAIGMFLVAFEMFGASMAGAVAAMGLAGLDRMALHTGLHPYFNQTWGFFALPFTLVLGWVAVQPRLSRPARRGTLLLLACFAVVLAFAYPLAAPIPAVPLGVFVWSGWRRRIAAGEDVFRFRDLYRGRHSLIWIVPVLAALAFPASGVAQKAIAAFKVLAPGNSLQSWGGDVGHFIPFNQFFSLPGGVVGSVLFLVVVGLALRGLADQPRAVAVGLGGLMVVGLLLAVYLRHRQYGYYFHFKLLAFIGPVLLLIAAVGADRLRRAGPVLVAALAIATAGAVVNELKVSGYQLPQADVQLAGWARALPRDASVRLDISPPLQLWAAYFLDARPLCSKLPILFTDYPHVPYSVKADYILTTNNLPRPADAVGGVLRRNQGYRLYRENPSVPGPSYCAYRRQDRIYSGLGHSRF